MNVKQTEADLKELFDKQHWNNVHLQIIFYGREHGKAGQIYPFRGTRMMAMTLSIDSSPMT